MIYADVDFILALAKKKDWLKTNAKNLYDKYNEELFISPICLIELMLVAEKINEDSLELIQFALKISKLVGDNTDDYLLACEYQKEYGLGVFDSLHIAKCKGKIISSDKKFQNIPFIETITLNNK
ncbi:type II toxin-antitoxin system VapC family toxin [Candidatus Pacearchaeota archaeon]|nr:type II toxin-antitoxin system VapC family toxin [Candidatus Pacearchaeota archaeon]